MGGSSAQCAVCGVERLLAVTLKTVTFTLPGPGLRPTCRWRKLLQHIC